MIYAAYGASLFALLALDAIWLGLVARSFFVSRIGHLFAENPNWWPAAIFYLAFAAAVVYFAVWPGYQESSFGTVILRGALLGAIAYATYDLTNMTLLPDWPLSVTVVDIAWGAFVAGASAAAGFAALGMMSGQ